MAAMGDSLVRHLTGGNRCRFATKVPGAVRRAKHPIPCQVATPKIFRFTEIRKWRMCRPSRLILEGRSCGRHVREPGLRWTRQRRAREVLGQGGLLSVSLKTTRGRAALKGSSRQRFVRLRRQGRKSCGGNGGPCVRQNRVVPAVVATVKLLRMRHARQPARCRRLL